MNDYPEKTCEIDRLVTHPKLVAKALRGEKTQQRRAGVYGYPGETFELESRKVPRPNSTDASGNGLGRSVPCLGPRV